MKVKVTKNKKETFKKDVKSQPTLSKIGQGKKTEKKQTNKREDEIELKEIKGFKILPYNIKNIDGKKQVNYIYFKKHSTASSFPIGLNPINFPTERTLFFYNLPVDFVEKDVKNVLQNSNKTKKISVNKIHIHCNESNGDKGSKGNVEFRKKNTTTVRTLDPLFAIKETVLDYQLIKFPSFAYASFNTIEDMNYLLNLRLKADNQNNIINEELATIVPERSNKENSGLLRWINKYNISRPSSEALMAYANEFVTEYQHHLEVQKYEADRVYDLPDEDGFVKVTTRGTHTSGSATVKAISHKKAKIIKQKVELEGFGKPVPIANFYRFETKNFKKQQLANLRSQFEEDKKRILQMKEAQMFQPKK
ncbi:hypothetical protein K502DRAFT_363204 [Neoconidiobolus thromboides FSU 785]|nr:hypothetical protein K502DRAFT_363204 [Neoconidiobolus thromboides FSU 785]